MAVTFTANTLQGNRRHVVVSSSLTGTVYYHWYLDGSWVGVNQTGQMDFYLADLSQAVLTVVDTNDAAFDYLAAAPVGYPAVRTVEFIESADADTDHYLLQMATGAIAPAEGDWADVLNGRVRHVAGQWVYRAGTPRLADLTWTWLSVVPYDLAGNKGTRAVLAREYLVRTPDAPNFVTSFAGGDIVVAAA